MFVEFVIEDHQAHLRFDLTIGKKSQGIKYGKYNN